MNQRPNFLENTLLFGGSGKTPQNQSNHHYTPSSSTQVHTDPGGLHGPRTAHWPTQLPQPPYTVVQDRSKAGKGSVV